MPRGCAEVTDAPPDNAFLEESNTAIHATAGGRTTAGASWRRFRDVAGIPDSLGPPRCTLIREPGDAENVRIAWPEANSRASHRSVP